MVKQSAPRNDPTIPRNMKQDQEKAQSLPNEQLPLTNLEEGIIGWTDQDDASMPLNWRPARKWCCASLLTAMTLMTPLSSSILAPALPFVDSEFNNTNEILGAFPVSIFCLATQSGPCCLLDSRSCTEDGR